MNDTTRDELRYEIESILLSMWQKGRHDQGYDLNPLSDRIIALVTSAITAVPTEQAAAGDAPGLDEMLDSVHPECRVERTIRVEGQWDARIAWPLEPIQEPHQESIWDRQEGTGPTRMDAIRAAVRRASAEGERE